MAVEPAGRVMNRVWRIAEAVGVGLILAAVAYSVWQMVATGYWQG